MKVALLLKTELHIHHIVEGLRPREVTVCRSRDELIDAIPDAGVLIVQNQGSAYHTVNGDVLKHAKALKLIQHFGVTCDATDTVAARGLGVPVAITPGQNSRSVAEQTLFLMMALSRNAKAGQRLLAEGRMGEAPCHELFGKRMCIVGMGTIGKMLVPMARGLGMSVVAVRKNPHSENLTALGVEAVHGTDRLHDAIRDADVTVLAMPLNDETFDFISDEEFAVMKRGSMLVNVSRGPNVNREALERALESGQLGAFGSDVYWTEPADPSDPLLWNERTYIAPHMGGNSVEALDRTVQCIVASVERAERGEPPINVVN